MVKLRVFYTKVNKKKNSQRTGAIYSKDLMSVFYVVNYGVVYGVCILFWKKEKRLKREKT